MKPAGDVYEKLPRQKWNQHEMCKRNSAEKRKRNQHGMCKRNSPDKKKKQETSMKCVREIPHIYIYKRKKQRKKEEARDV